MKALSRLTLLIGLILICATGTAVAGQHLNAYAIQGDFICVSCNEPLNQVNSPESQAEKQNLVQFVNQGLSLDQIKTRMVSIYGPGVLARPPAHGINLLIYILPPAVLVGGLGLLAYNLPRWRRRARLAAPDGAGPTGPPPGSPEARRLDRELAEFDA